MLKLMKYEFKKTLFSKYILLAFLAIAEVIFLIGVFAKKDSFLAWGISGLIFCTMIGLFYIGIESIIVMQQDLNTKQSYMLFLTPYNSYEILGAKILQNGLAIFLAGILAALLAAIDFSVMMIYLDGIEELWKILNHFLAQVHMEITITRTEIGLGVLGVLASWLSMIVNAYLAIVLSATFLAGKKFNKLISFLIYMLIVFVEGRILSLLPEMSNISQTLSLVVGGDFVMIVLIYFITGWIMDRKLSV